MTGLRKMSIAALCLLLPLGASAEIVLPVLFCDGMVLQREAPIRVFGRATDGASITVLMTGHEETTTARDGTWLVTLPALPAGGPYELRISGDDSEIRIRDVMLGEVWLAGGQSNMEFAMQGLFEFEKFLPPEVNPQLRFIHIPVTDFGEINREGLGWKTADEKTVRCFSAVAYLFAAELQKRLGVTVGIIGSYRGSTANENWMTPESIKQEPELKYLFENYEKEYSKFKDESAYEEGYHQFLIDLKEWKAKGGRSYGMIPFAPMGPKAHLRPSGLYDCMIKPLQPYRIKGCVWYQGEGNSGRHEEFRTLFPAFVKGWRASWENPDMPFYFVQLPGYGKGASWPQFRQSQLDCSQHIRQCGMVVAEGCGDETNIHPRIKKPIGDRLAIAISAEVYGQDHLPYGPIVKSVKFQNGKAGLRFRYSGRDRKSVV